MEVGGDGATLFIGFAGAGRCAGCWGRERSIHRGGFAGERGERINPPILLGMLRHPHRQDAAQFVFGRAQCWCAHAYCGPGPLMRSSNVAFHAWLRGLRARHRSLRAFTRIQFVEASHVCR